MFEWISNVFRKETPPPVVPPKKVQPSSSAFAGWGFGGGEGNTPSAKRVRTGMESGADSREKGTPHAAAKEAVPKERIPHIKETEESRKFEEVLSALKASELARLTEGSMVLQYVPLTEGLAVAWGEKNVSPRLCELFQKGRARLKEIEMNGVRGMSAYQQVVKEMLAQIPPQDLEKVQQAAEADRARQQRANGGLGMAMSSEILLQSAFVQYMYWQIGRDREKAQKAAAGNPVDKAA